MKRQNSKLLGIILVMICLFQLGTARAQGNNEKPNIIFVLVDDLRWDAMGFTNKYPFLETPNIDKLRKEGVHFENTFCTHSLCAPSRATFLTGTFSQRHGVSTNQEGREFNPGKTPSFSQILQNNGYSTAFIGKWHMGSTNMPRKGFDYWCSFLGQGNYYGNDLNINGKSVRNEGYITDELNTYALQFIKDNPNNQPFCLYLSHKAVHQPFTPPVRDEKLYQTDLVPEPENWKDDMASKPAWQRITPSLNERRRMREKEVKNVAVYKTRKVGPWPAKSGKGEQKNYLRCISAIDDGLGKIYELLKDKGILDNTIIVFTGDNGYFHGEHGKGDKRLAYNESMRIPLVMRYPKLANQGGSVSEIVLNADIAPTFLDLANVPIPSQMQGKSLLPLLQGKEKDWRTSFLFTYWPDLKQFIPRIVAVRTKDYLYSTTPDIDDIDELYDESNDPYEMNNLANDPKYGEVKTKLRQELEKLKKESSYIAQVPRPTHPPKLNVAKGKLFTIDFGKQSSLIPKAITKEESSKGTCGRFNGESSMVIPYSEDFDPTLGTFVVECTIQPDSPNGVIASFGNSRDGWALFMEDGKPGFVVAHDNYLQFADGTYDITGSWCQLTAVIENYKNSISLYGNGQLLEQRQILLPIKARNNPEEIVIGNDAGELIDPEGFSKYPFQGLIKTLKIYRKEWSGTELKKRSSN